MSTAEAGVRHEGLRVRLAPTRAQATYLAGCAGASRRAYNFALELIVERQELWTAQREADVPAADRVKLLSARDLQDAWHAAKDEVAPWHGEYPSKIYLFALRRAHQAHRDWLGGKTGFPRFKAKRRTRPSFTVCEQVSLVAGQLGLPKMAAAGLGAVRITAPDARQAKLRRLVRRNRARIVSATITRDACGTWWAALTIERTVTAAAVAPRMPTRVVGVDVGIKTLAVAADTDGQVLLEAGGAKSMAAGTRRLRRAQRALSRKDRVHSSLAGLDRPRKSPSVRREAARVTVARAHRRVADARRTAMHQTTRRLADLDAVIVIEDLNVRGMTAAGGARKRGLNRHLADAAFAELARQLDYKLKAVGPTSGTAASPAGRLIRADRWFPSSKRCAVCQVDNQDLTLADRTWVCSSCGTSHDRDVNAATNLAAWGRAAILADVLNSLFCPEQTGAAEPTWVGDRHGGGPSAGGQPTTRHARTGDKPSRRIPRRGLVSAPALMPAGTEQPASPPPETVCA